VRERLKGAVLISLALLLAEGALGQISEGGTPPSLTLGFGLLKALPSQIQAVAMPPVDVQALLAEDRIEETQGLPFRFGYPIDVNYSLDNSGTWTETGDGGKLWRLRIESSGAHSLNLLYSQYHLPPGAKLFIYNDDQSMIIGAFTDRNNKDDGQFATAPVKGAVSILEYYEPPEVRGQGELAVSRVVHAYKNIFSFDQTKDLLNYGGSDACNVNINCPEGQSWQNDKRSVAMVLTGGGSRICTGALINNVLQDQTPYFLTAYHCLGGESTWIFMFNYESPGCENVNGPTSYTLSGSTRRASYSTSDFALLQISESPLAGYNIYYAGWSNLDVASQSSVCIHHPVGDIKKIAFDYDSLTQADYLSTTGTTHWRIGSWNIGTTEPGSSGSPLFDHHHRIVGQLHGGYASCTSLTSDWFGKFARSWNGGGTPSTRLKDWLDPNNTGATTLNGLDPRLGVSIMHLPLPNTIDTVTAYEVICSILSDSPLLADSLLLYFRTSAVWQPELLQPTGNLHEYHAVIPAQSAGSQVFYYLFAKDTQSRSDTTDVFAFQVEYVPAISAGPGSFVKTLQTGDTTYDQVIIGNSAPGALTYAISVLPQVNPNSLFESLRTAGLVEPAQREYPAGFNDYVDVKGGHDPRKGFPVEKNAGGPDNFGHYWIDSDQPGGPAFNWIEISGTGADITFGLTDDNYTGPHAIGFAFPYYGNSYNQFYLGSNGIIGFDTTGMWSRTKISIPTPTPPSNILAWLWDDLNPDDPNNPGARVYLYSDTSKCVIEFVNYPEYFANPGDVITAEVILESDGAVTYQYRNIASGFDAASCAVGMENLDGNDGLQVAYLTPYLHDSLAIKLYRPYQWLTPSKSSGTLAYGMADTISCMFTTGKLDSGVYNSIISISSNDPDPADSPWDIPAQLMITIPISYLCGDANRDGRVNVADAVFDINYVFKGGPAAYPIKAGDANCDRAYNLGDAVYIVNYVFKNGPPPCCPP